MMTQPAPLPFGTALALAQRTITAPLDGIREAERTTAPAWFTLIALAMRGPSTADALAGLLATNGLDRTAVGDLLATMERDGLVEVDDGAVALTAAGTARHAHLRDRIGAIAARVAERFGPDRVEAARELLQEIAETDPREISELAGTPG
jgi:DNA-binding MarR family transcriptional regulator